MAVSRYKKIVWVVRQIFLLWVFGRLCCAMGDEMPEAPAAHVLSRGWLLIGLVILLFFRVHNTNEAFL